MSDFLLFVIDDKNFSSFCAIVQSHGHEAFNIHITNLLFIFTPKIINKSLNISHQLTYLLYCGMICTISLSLDHGFCKGPDTSARINTDKILNSKKVFFNDSSFPT